MITPFHVHACLFCGVENTNANQAPNMLSVRIMHVEIGTEYAFC